jgi:hypothetical protein
MEKAGREAGLFLYPKEIRMRRLPLAAAILLVLAPAPAFAWGADGHRMIGELGMKTLPATLPAFLRSAAAVATVGYLAPEPDRIRGAGTVNDKEHDAAHFVDANDDLTVLGGPPIKALPLTREDYDTALRAVNSDQYKAGYLPYSIQAGYELVRKDMALYRLAVVGAKYAAAKAQRADYAATLPRRQSELLQDIGIWAHFVGDGSQPLHVTVHYNGWGNYPNPQGFTADHIHSPFESDYVHAHVTEAAVQAAMPALKDCGCAIGERVAGYLTVTAAGVAPVYTLWKAGDFTNATPAATKFATLYVARGAAELRDLIVMAWKDSDNATVGYPGTKITDVEKGKAAALAQLKE